MQLDAAAPEEARWHAGPVQDHPFARGRRGAWHREHLSPTSTFMMTTLARVAMKVIGRPQGVVARSAQVRDARRGRDLRAAAEAAGGHPGAAPTAHGGDHPASATRANECNHSLHGSRNPGSIKNNPDTNVEPRPSCNKSVARKVAVHAQARPRSVPTRAARERTRLPTSSVPPRPQLPRRGHAGPRMEGTRGVAHSGQSGRGEATMIFAWEGAGMNVAIRNGKAPTASAPRVGQETEKGRATDLRRAGGCAALTRARRWWGGGRGSPGEG